MASNRNVVVPWPLRHSPSSPRPTSAAVRKGFGQKPKRSPRPPKVKMTITITSGS